MRMFVSRQPRTPVRHYLKGDEMISSDGFRISKRMAQLPLGTTGKDSFVYWSDVARQWEWAYRNDKITKLISSQSMQPDNLHDVITMLGALSNEEIKLAHEYRCLYEELTSLLTSVPVEANVECDLYETLLDLRLARDELAGPRRVLDIGPGAGRHLVAMFLDPQRKGGIYAGVESVEMCYSFQNMLASLVRSRLSGIKFIDTLDYQFARMDVPDMYKTDSGTIYHLPLWKHNLLPNKFFDVILCNYILDELSPDDFTRVLAIIQRCLADEGVLYCRGSQQRAMMGSVYLFGYSRFHGMDITRNLLARDLRVHEGRLVASQLTRKFVRSTARTFGPAAGPYSTFTNDVELVDAVQKDFVREQVQSLRGSRCVVWGDEGYGIFDQQIRPHLDGLRISAVTHRSADEKTTTPFGCPQLPPSRLCEFDPQAVIIASMKDRSAYRMLNELMGAKRFTTLRRFHQPIAFACREAGGCEDA